MKKLLQGIFLGYLSLSLSLVWAGADEEDCIAAVDAMDSMNVNQKLCDYSNSGLNGVIHKAFNDKGDSSAEQKQDSAAVAEASTAQLVKVLAIDVASEKHLAAVRSTAVYQALATCPAGFSLVRESYRPKSQKAIELMFEYQCN